MHEGQERKQIVSSWRCPPSAATPALSSAHRGESAGHWGTVRWSAESLGSKWAATTGSSVPAAKKLQSAGLTDAKSTLPEKSKNSVWLLLNKNSALLQEFIYSSLFRKIFLKNWWTLKKWVNQYVLKGNIEFFKTFFLVTHIATKIIVILLYFLILT